MDVSVIIPTRGRPERLRACLASLAASAGETPAFEVIVSVDGPDAGEGAVTAAFAGSMRVRTIDGDAKGPAAARNRAIALAEAPLTLLLNDDVVCAPDLVARHAEYQKLAASKLGRPAMVLGSAPWAVVEPDRRIDRLVRHTSVVFFYDKMDAADPWRDWGFRHAWTLNLSVSTWVLQELRFCEGLARPVYEDVEMAFRAAAKLGSPVLYRPDAVVTHVHRYEPLVLLEREAVLGHQAWRLAEVSPACAEAIFRKDVRTREAVDEAWGVVEDFDAEVPARMSWFASLADEAERSADGAAQRAAAASDFESALPLRRWCRALGHVSAAERGRVDRVVAAVQDHWRSACAAERAV